MVGIPDDDWLKLSNGWLKCFKDRNGLKEMRQHGEAASARVETMERERKRVQELIGKYRYELRDIFNMDGWNRSILWVHTYAVFFNSSANFWM